ncbi:MAG: hypothetical protein CMH52_04040 [Myxococcales bacterium]|nr:hypothetical protein [Myxococcales bacterium]
MKALDLKFRVDDLNPSQKEFAGELPLALLQTCLPGMVGDLGYRPQTAATISGQVYLSAGGEVVVTGEMTVTVDFDCTRCLAPRTVSLTSSHEHVLVKRRREREADAELVVTSDDAEVDTETYQGDEIDLTEVFRQDLVLDLPMNPSCELGGTGDCEFDEDTEKALEKPMDPRWAPLLELKKKMN